MGWYHLIMSNETQIFLLGTVINRSLPLDLSFVHVPTVTANSSGVSLNWDPGPYAVVMIFRIVAGQLAEARWESAAALVTLPRFGDDVYQFKQLKGSTKHLDIVILE